MALKVERNEWSNELKEAQDELRYKGFDRSLYWSIADEMLCWHPFHEWMKSDILSRPFRWIQQTELDLIIHGPAKKNKKVKKNEQK